jgi:hypothetical protein
MSPQHPLWRAYQQDPVKVEHWLKVEFPRIKKLAKKTGADHYFGDEAGVRSDHHAGTTWSARGVTPAVSTTGARFGFNMISAVSPRGALGKLPHRDKPTMRKAAESYLRSLQRSPARTRALFQKPSVRYAA